MSDRLWSARRAEWEVGTVVVAAAVAVPLFLAVGALAGVLALVGVAVVAACVYVSLRSRCRSWHYEERGDDLVVSRGVLFQRTSVVPYGRMQFVDVTAGPVERGFGLATVQLHTAAAATNARIPGLDRAEAERLRDQLAALGEARSSGL
ncbi:MAG: PH domain-containing protein [Jatrophihabitans sp.]|uniref:PH domain-containing protein n=1 Tax=Jatrophihabitans sp. TaxID=1932789 RepID=UPI003F7EACC2